MECCREKQGDGGSRSEAGQNPDERADEHSEETVHKVKRLNRNLKTVTNILKDLYHLSNPALKSQKTQDPFRELGLQSGLKNQIRKESHGNAHQNREPPLLFLDHR